MAPLLRFLLKNASDRTKVRNGMRQHRKRIKASRERVQKTDFGNASNHLILAKQHLDKTITLVEARDAQGHTLGSGDGYTKSESLNSLRGEMRASFLSELYAKREKVVALNKLVGHITPERPGWSQAQLGFKTLDKITKQKLDSGTAAHFVETAIANMEDAVTQANTSLKRFDEDKHPANKKLANTPELHEWYRNYLVQTTQEYKHVLAQLQKYHESLEYLAKPKSKKKK